MNKVLTLLILVAVLAVFKVALAALTIAVLLSLVYAFATRPSEMLLFLGACTISSLASARPTAFIVALAAVGVVGVVAGARRKGRSQLLLTDGREDPLTWERPRAAGRAPSLRSLLGLLRRVVSARD